MAHRVAFEFKVSRRIGWDDDNAEELRDHFKAVCNEVALATGVRMVNVRADLISAALWMEIDLEGDSAFACEANARELVGSAIREAGAAHVGLLSDADEARVRPVRNAWHGLRTPQWTQYRAEVSALG